MGVGCLRSRALQPAWKPKTGRGCRTCDLPSVSIYSWSDARPLLQYTLLMLASLFIVKQVRSEPFTSKTCGEAKTSEVVLQQRIRHATVLLLALFETLKRSSCSLRSTKRAHIVLFAEIQASVCFSPICSLVTLVSTRVPGDANH